jgi:hypothetical protein
MSSTGIRVPPTFHARGGAHGAEHHSFTGVRMGAPLAFSSTTTNLAGSVLLFDSCHRAHPQQSTLRKAPAERALQLEFMEKLAAIIPRPAVNLLVYLGVLALHARTHSSLSGSEDHLMPPAVQRSNAKHYKLNTITEITEFPGRSHLMPAQQGWDESVGGAKHPFVIPSLAPWQPGVPLAGGDTTVADRLSRLSHGEHPRRALKDLLNLLL